MAVPLKLAALCVALVALVLASAWFLSGSREPAQARIEPTPASTPQEVEPVVDSRPVAETTRSTVEVPQAAAQIAPPGVRVLGRVVDFDGVPLPDLRVTLQSARGPWAEGVEVPKRRLADRETEGFEVRTGADGRFIFEAPLPTASWIFLDVEPDALHAPAHRSFQSWKEPLRLGPNDLGDIVLHPTGAIEGRILSRTGGGIAEAGISVDRADQGTPFSSTFSEADGSFLARGVVEGKVRLRVRAPGNLHAESPWVDVKTQATTRLDVVLEDSPVIAGQVVDEQNRPVPNVVIRANARDGGYGCEGVSAQDGRFALQLFHDAPHSLAIEHEGFEPTRPFQPPYFDPGTRDARIVLERGRSVIFSVVDERSGDPIERYGIDLQVLDHDGNRTSERAEPLEPEVHAGGRCSLVRPEGKLVVQVEAPGHAPVSQYMPAGDSPAGEIVIRLARGSSITGRLVGERVGGGSVSLERARSDEGSRRRRDRNDWADLSPFAGRNRRSIAAPDGTFRFDDLAAGTYSLHASAGENCPLKMDRVAVAAGAVAQLGDLALTPGARIEGRLRAGDAAAGRGWHLQAGERPALAVSTADEEGRFELGGLPPGVHAVRVSFTHRDSIRLTEVTLAAGETRQMDLDVSAMLPARISVRVTRAGSPLVGMQLQTSCRGGKAVRLDVARPTDQDGRAEAELAPCAELELEVVARSGLCVGRVPGVLDIAPGAKLEVGVEIEAGEVELVFPADVPIGERTVGGVTLRPPEETDAEPLRVGLHGTGKSMSHGSVQIRGSVVELGLVPPGSYEVDASLGDEIIQQKNGSPWVDRTHYTKLRGRLDLAPGGRARCVLERVPERTERSR